MTLSRPIRRLVGALVLLGLLLAPLLALAQVTPGPTSVVPAIRGTAAPLPTPCTDGLVRYDTTAGAWKKCSSNAWVSAAGAGTVTQVSGTSPVSVSSGTTTPVVSVADATGASKGIVQVGTGLSVTSGTVSVAYGTSSGTAAAGNDSRLSDARAPLAHASSHAAAGSDPVTLATSQVAGFTAAAAAAAPVQSVAGRTGTVMLSTSDVSGLGTAATKNVGTTTGTVAAGDDSRLSDARTPTAHASTHAAAGSDPVALSQSQVTGLTSALAGIPTASSTTPADVGTAAVGTGTTFARADHVHALPDVGAGSGSVGSASQSVTLTTDAKGRVTARSAQSIAIAASQVTSGTMATARLGSGTASSSTYLRGDSTWAAVSGGPTYVAGIDDATLALLLHLNGSNGSTTFTDTSFSTKTVSRAGNAQISTAQSKFGGASALFDGTGDYLQVTGNSAFDFGSSSFTVEMWVRSTATNSFCTLVSKPSSGSGTFTAGAWTFLFNTGSNNGRLAVYAADFNGASPLLDASSGTVNDGSWHHVAWVRNGNAHALYLDGVSVATASWSGSITALTSQPLNIGSDLNFGSRDFAGYIDELRISNGTARYTGGFTPPAAAFTDGVDTTQLPTCSAAGTQALSDNALYVCTSASGPTWRRVMVSSF